jgi:tetratricopeptide (TPR) repeat protein
MQNNKYLTEAAKHYQDKNYGDAITVATRGLEMMQQDFHLLHLRANCLTALKEYKRALVDLKLLIRSYPSEPRAYLKAVKCYRNLKQANAALKILEYGRSRVDKNDIKYHVL